MHPAAMLLSPLAPTLPLFHPPLQVGAVPLAMWGVWGTPLPHQSPMTLVLGKPIEVPKVADPPPEEVERVLQVSGHSWRPMCLWVPLHAPCAATL